MTTRLSDSHLRLVVSRIPSDVRTLMASNQIVLAGGFIRSTICGEKPNDIDLFCRASDDAKKIMSALALERRGRLHVTENALTVIAPPRMPVQMITRWRYEHPNNVIPDFDFTIAQAAIWAEPNKLAKDGFEWKSEIADTYYADLSSRTLVYTSPQREEAAGGSTMRMRKFLRAGYQITAPSMAAVMARVFMKIRTNDLTHSEEGCAQVITGLLREVDPMLVVDGLDVLEGE